MSMTFVCGVVRLLREEINMAMSDCEKCWDTPCTCGYEYRNYTKSQRMGLAAVVLGIRVIVLTGKVFDIVPEIHPKKLEPSWEGKKLSKSKISELYKKGDEL